MKNKPDYQMKIVTSPEINDQYGKRKYLSSKQPARKSIAAIAAALLTFLLFLTNTRQYAKHKILGIKAPKKLVSINISLPSYDITDDLSSDEKPKKLRSRIVYNYSAPSVIKRPFSDRILPGTMIKAKLVSGAADGLIKAVASESLSISGNDVIPIGSVFIGSGTSGKHRLYVRFSEIVLPDGSIQNIQAVASDLSDKIDGLKGSRLEHYGWKLAATTGLHFAAGLTEGLRERDVRGGAVVPKTDHKNAALSGASNAALELAKESMSEIKSQKPTYTIPFGTHFYILFSRK